MAASIWNDNRAVEAKPCSSLNPMPPKGAQGHVRIMGKMLLPVWIGGALVLFAGASLSHARNLDEAVRMGLSINPEVRSAQSEEAAATTDVTIAKGGYYPALSVSAGPRSANFDGLSYDVTVAQMLYDWGRTTAKVDGAKAARSKKSEQLRQKQDKVALDIVETYLDVLSTQRQAEGLGSYIAWLRDMQKLTLARSEGNYADRAEPERVTLELARAQEQLAIERGTLDNARNIYTLLVGERPERLAAPSPASVASYVTHNNLDTIVRASPAVRLAQEDTQSAKADLGEIRSSTLPQLNIEMTAMRRDVGGVPYKDSSVMLRLRMSDIQGFSNFLRPRSAERRIEAASLNENAVTRDTQREVQTLLDSAMMMRDRVAALEAQVSASAAVGRTYFDQFTVGRRDLLDLLNTRRENFEANRQLINIRIDLLRVEYRTAAKLGLIGPLIEDELK